MVKVDDVLETQNASFVSSCLNIIYNSNVMPPRNMSNTTQMAESILFNQTPIPILVINN